MALVFKRLVPTSQKSLSTILKRFFPNGNKLFCLTYQLHLCFKLPLQYCASLPGICRVPRGGFRVFPATTFPARHPVIFATLFSCAKTATADLMVQQYVEKADKINWHRGKSAEELLHLFVLHWPPFTNRKK